MSKSDGSDFYLNFLFELLFGKKIRSNLPVLKKLFKRKGFNKNKNNNNNFISGIKRYIHIVNTT